VGIWVELCGLVILGGTVVVIATLVVCDSTSLVLVVSVKWFKIFTNFV
jgi:hypothetical protein